MATGFRKEKTRTILRSLILNTVALRKKRANSASIPGWLPKTEAEIQLLHVPGRTDVLKEVQFSQG